MSQPKQSNGKSATVPASWCLSAAALMLAIWVLLVGGIHRDETIVGVLCVCASTLALRIIAGVRQQKVRITWHDFLSGWRLPWYALQDVFLVSRVLLRDVLFSESPPSAYRVCGFETSNSDPRDLGRRVLVTAYSSATPNVVVIGVDYAQSRLLFHQLQRNAVSEGMRDLGAKA